MGACSGVCQQQAKTIVNESAIVTETIIQALQEDTTISRPIQREERYLKMETGAIYEGDLVKGIRSGRGRQVWPDGDFVNDMADGKGILVNAEGSVYDGNGWKIKQAVLGSTIAMMGYTMKDNGWRTNSMVLERRSIKEVLRQIKLLDECYEGEFFRGAKQGFGKLSLNDEEFYEGEFQSGMMHGKGTYTWRSKNLIRENGKRDGWMDLGQ